MKCPNCNTTLIMADRQGIEIDYCPECRGVWLDRGELDKIIERSAAYTMGHDTDRSYEQKQYASAEDHHQQKPYNDPYYKHKKKKGFLGDLFDFD